MFGCPMQRGQALGGRDVADENLHGHTLGEISLGGLRRADEGTYARSGRAAIGVSARSLIKSGGPARSPRTRRDVVTGRVRLAARKGGQECSPRSPMHSGLRI